MTQSEYNQMMRALAEALTKKFKELGIPLKCTYTSWEDAMRAYGSGLGPNITDIGLVFRNEAGKTGSAETFGFKIRSDNFNEVLIEIDARRFKIVVSDPSGQNPRIVTLAHALENAGRLFKHAGLPEDCNLYYPELDNSKVKLRLDLIFAPQGEKEEGAEWAVKEFSLTGYNYQARDGNARNIGLWCHPQGTSCADDGDGKLYLRPQVWDETKQELSAFWTEAEDTGKTVQDMHTETAEESEAARLRGKGTAVRAGCDGWDSVPNLFSYIQIPRVQTRNAPRRGPIAAPMDLPPGAAPSWAEMEEEEDEPPRYRSSRSVATAPRPSLTSARLSRGSYAGVHPGIRSTTVERAKEPITITCTMVFMLGGEEIPDTETVTSCWSVLQRMAKIAGTPKELMDAPANLTTGAPLSKDDFADIAEKQVVHPATSPPVAQVVPKPPVVGMVID